MASPDNDKSAPGLADTQAETRGTGSAARPRRGTPISVLLIVATSMMFVPLLLLGVWQVVTINSELREETGQQIQQLSYDIRNDVDRVLVIYLAVLQTLAASPSIDDNQLGRLHAQSSTILRPLGLFALMRDTYGQQLFNTRVPYGTDLPREVGFDDPVLETHRPYVSDLIVGAVARKPVLGLSVPVLRDGELKSILTLSIEPHLFDDIVTRSDLPASWTIDLVDRTGATITSSASDRDERRMQARADRPLPRLGSARTVTLGDGTEVVEAARRSRESDWTVVVSVPSEAIARQVRAPVLWMLTAVAAIASVALLGSYALGRSIVSSLTALMDSARALGERRPVDFEPSVVREANMIGAALVSAGRERDAHEEQIELLMREVAHRSRNLITVVLSMTRRMTGNSVAEFRERLAGRMQGLAAGQDALMGENWQAADLTVLIEKQVSVFADTSSDRVAIDGPPVRLTTHAAQAIGMALHELGTNATKHGALSTKQGHVSVSWRIVDADGEDRLVMRWQETGGAKPRKAAREGFGTTLIKRVLESTFGARVDIHVGPQGFAWEFDVALSKIV